MTKKINQRKKITIKLESGYSYMVADSTMLANMYIVYTELFINVKKTDKYKEHYVQMLDKITSAIENIYTKEDESYEDWQ